MMFALCDSGYSSPVCYSSPASSSAFYPEVETPHGELPKRSRLSAQAASRRLLFKASPVFAYNKVDVATQTSSGCEDVSRIVARRLRRLANDFETQYFTSTGIISRSRPIMTFIDFFLQ